MLLTFRQFIAFINGRAGAVAHIANVPSDLAARIGADSGALYLGFDYARKLWEKHRLLPHHFSNMQNAIEFGYCGISRREGKTALAFIYDDRKVFGRPFMLVVKTSAGKEVLWVKTFHMSDDGEYKRQTKKLERIRDHLQVE